MAVAASADNFKTLVAAVKAAGLVETLQGKGPFTVFAPTDAALAKLSVTNTNAQPKRSFHVPRRSEAEPR